MTLKAPLPNKTIFNTRRVIVETGMNYNNRYAKRYTASSFAPQHGAAKFAPKIEVKWRVKERKTKGNIVVEVNERPLRVPQFSVQTGTARIDENGQVLDMVPFISIYGIPDLIASLQEVYDKYLAIRESMAREKENEFRRYHDDAEIDYDAEEPEEEPRAEMATPRRR